MVGVQWRIFVNGLNSLFPWVLFVAALREFISDFKGMWLCEGFIRNDLSGGRKHLAECMMEDCLKDGYGHVMLSEV